jgi:hypothetical protein
MFDMQHNPDELFKTICGLTKKLSVALEQGNLDAIGRVLDERQMAIDTYNSIEDKKPLTKDQLKILTEIIDIDKQAYVFADELVINFKKKFMLLKKLNVGLLEYNKNKYDITSGQIVDKKR